METIRKGKATMKPRRGRENNILWIFSEEDVAEWNRFTGPGSNNEDGTLSYISAGNFSTNSLTTSQKPRTKDLPICCLFHE
jgi:hypothetical protein